MSDRRPPEETSPNDRLSWSAGCFIAASWTQTGIAGELSALAAPLRPAGAVPSASGPRN
jgi:hypothetical protein